MAEFAAGEILTAEKLNRRGIKARGRRDSASTGTTTIVGVLRLDDVPILNGRSYRISATGLFGTSTVNNDRIVITIRYTTDGATPSTTSAILPGGQAYQFIQIVGGSTGEDLSVLETVHEPGADQTLSLLLCVGRNLGTGTVGLFADTDHKIELKIEDVGVAVGDTGTDI